MEKLRKYNNEIVELDKKLKQLKATTQTQTKQFNAKMDEINVSERIVSQEINELNQKIKNHKQKLDEAEGMTY